MIKDLANLKEKTLAMTGFFETSTGYPGTYGVMSGNHDAQGGSFGVLQFNWGTGSLQPLLKYMFESQNADTRAALVTTYDEIYDVVYNKTTAEQVTWGDSITDYVVDSTGHQVKQPYKDEFMALGIKQSCIDKQVTYSEDWRPNAIKWFNNLGLFSRRGYALLWDISVQMGRLLPMNLILNDFKGIVTTGKTRGQIEQEKLNIICNRCSNEANKVTGANISIVYNRKKMIVDGTGDYYGATFDAAQYDLSINEAAFRGGIFI